MLDAYASQDMEAQLEAWAGAGLDGLGCDPGAIDATQSFDGQERSDSAIRQLNDDALVDSALGLFRRNLSQFERLSPEEEKALGVELEQLYFDIVNAILVRQISAKDFLAVLKRVARSPVKLPAVGDKQSYYILLREIKELTTPSTKMDALHKVIGVFTDFTNNRQKGDAILPNEVQQAIKTIAWPGPFIIAVARRYVVNSDSKTQLDLALQKYLKHHGHPLSVKIKPSKTSDLLTLTRRYYPLRDALVVKNIPLVFSIVNRYCLHSTTFPELLQEGIIGLIRAAEKYRVSTGNRFSTYAYTWIESKVRAARVKNNSLVPISPDLNTELARLYSCISELRVDGRNYDNHSLAKKLDSSPQRIQELLNLKRGIISFDSSLFSDEASTLHVKYPDKKSDTVKDVSDQELRQRLQELLPKVLNEREVFVINTRFGLNTIEQRTLGFIGKELSVSGESVRLIELNALKKLRNYLEVEPAGKDLFLCLLDSDV